MRNTKRQLQEFPGTDREAEAILQTVSEAVKKTGFSGQIIRKWIRDGKIDGFIYRGFITLFKNEELPPRKK